MLVRVSLLLSIAGFQLLKAADGWWMTEPDECEVGEDKRGGKEITSV